MSQPLGWVPVAGTTGDRALDRAVIGCVHEQVVGSEAHDHAEGTMHGIVAGGFESTAGRGLALQLGWIPGGLFFNLPRGADEQARDEPRFDTDESSTQILGAAAKQNNGQCTSFDRSSGGDEAGGLGILGNKVQEHVGGFPACSVILLPAREVQVPQQTMAAQVEADGGPRSQHCAGSRASGTRASLHACGRFRQQNCSRTS